MKITKNICAVIAAALAVASPCWAQEFHTIPPAVEGNTWNSIALGVGFDSARGLPMFTPPQVMALLRDGGSTNVRAVQSPGNDVYSRLRNDLSDCAKEFSADLSARYQMNGIAKIAFGASYRDWRRLVRRHQTVEIRMVHQIKEEELILDTLNVTNPVEFLGQYGDSLVRKVRTGGSAMIQIDVIAENEKIASDIAASLAAEGTLTDDQIKARVGAAQSQERQGTEIHVTARCRPYLPIDMPTNLSQLSAFVDTFRRESEAHPVPIAFTISPSSHLFSGTNWYPVLQSWRAITSDIMLSRIGADTALARFEALDSFFSSVAKDAKPEMQLPVQAEIVKLRRVSQDLGLVEGNLASATPVFNDRSVRTALSNTVAEICGRTISDGTTNIAIRWLGTDLLERGRLFGYTVEQKQWPQTSFQIQLPADAGKADSFPQDCDLARADFRLWAKPLEGLLLEYEVRVMSVDTAPEWIKTKGGATILGTHVVVKCPHWLIAPKLDGGVRSARTGRHTIKENRGVLWVNGPPTGVEGISIGQARQGGSDAVVKVGVAISPIDYYVVRTSNSTDPKTSIAGTP